MNRRRVLGLGLVLGTAALALTTLKGEGHTVSVRYEAPPGPLTVTLTTAEGERIRRITFGEAAVRQHELSLLPGRYQARLELPHRPAVDRSFSVEADGAVLVEWAR